MIDDVPEPEYVNFDALSVLEIEEEEICDQSVLSSQFDFTYHLNNSTTTPKLSVATNITRVGPSKTKMTYNAKRDEFDYNSYIKEELQKLKADDLDPHTRKRLIQKIRNRMSAQRSRNKSKMVTNQLQEENQYLRLHNSELMQKIQLLKEENCFLREQINDNRPSKLSISTIFQDDSHIALIPQLYRTSRPETVTLYKNILVISAVVLALTLSPQGTPEGVKLSGVVPLLTTDINKSVKQLQNMESICKSYCLKNHQCDETVDKTVNEVRLLSDITKDLQLYTGPNSRDKLVPLMCFDEKNEKVKHIFLFKESSLHIVKSANEMLYAPELVIIKPQIGFVNN